MTKLALALAFLMAATTYAQAQSWGMARRTGLTHQDRPRYHREPCWSAAAKPDCQQKARATQSRPRRTAPCGGTLLGGPPQLLTDGTDVHKI